MKLIALVLFFLLCCYSLLAQNLVPNPSFEEYTDCPDDYYQVYLCEGWNSYRGSPDYYNRCSHSIYASAPDNWMGYQEPATGNAYVGLETFGYATFTGMKNLREIIGGKLKSPLIQGAKYYVSLKVSLTDKNSAIASNNLGITFSTVPYLDEYDSTNYPTPITNRAMGYSKSIIADTANWITVSSSFIADSAYLYVLVGNFFDDAHTDTLRLLNNSPTGLFEAFYFVDDVCVSEDSSVCNLLTSTNFISTFGVNIYPNPAHDRVYISAIGESVEYTVSLFSLMGSNLFSTKAKGASSLTLSQFPSGVYFLEIKHNNTITRQKLIIIH